MSALGTLEEVQAALRRPPFQRFLQIEAESVDPEAGQVVFRLPFRDDYARQPESAQLHGGAIAALIDIAGDYALAVRLGHFVPTIDLRVDYLRPAHGALRAEAKVVRAGRTIGVVDVEVTDSEGRQVALGRGTYGTRAG